MDVNVAVKGPEPRFALEGLSDWLRREEELRGRVRLVTPAPGPEQMGSVSDALTVASGAGGAGAVLARSLAEWLKQRTSLRVAHAARRAAMPALSRRRGL